MRKFIDVLNVVARYGEMSQFFEGLDAFQGDQIIMTKKHFFDLFDLGYQIRWQFLRVQTIDLSKVQRELTIHYDYFLLHFGRLEGVRQLYCRII